MASCGNNMAGGAASFSSSMQSSQTTVFGGQETMTLAEVEFNSMPPDATLLPNVEVCPNYRVNHYVVPSLGVADIKTQVAL